MWEAPERGPGPWTSSPLGLEWRAFHLFYHADRNLALRHWVLPAVDSLLKQDLVERFFFIRYPLGGPHIRLRILCRPDGAAEAEAQLQRAAAEFLIRWPSTGGGDRQPTVQEGGFIPSDFLPLRGEAVPIYPDNTLLPFSFEPETERYGGADLVDCSYDFFFLSSIQSLAFVAAHSEKPWARQLSSAMSLLAQQAWGFAQDEDEFLDLLTYRLPVWQSIAESVAARSDRVFEESRELFRSLLLRELNDLAEDYLPATVIPGTGRAYAETARRLSREIKRADPKTRRQIGTSQIHMTANRLGLSNPEELYIGRILWRTARDLAASEPTSWRRLLESLAACQNVREGIDPPLVDLIPSFLVELRIWATNILEKESVVQSAACGTEAE